MEPNHVSFVSSTLVLGRRTGSGHLPRQHSSKGVLFRHDKHCIFGTNSSGTVRRFDEPPTITLCFLSTCCTTVRTQHNDIARMWKVSGTGMGFTRILQVCGNHQRRHHDRRLYHLFARIPCAPKRGHFVSPVSFRLADHGISSERFLRTKLCGHGNR